VAWEKKWRTGTQKRQYRWSA